jgi:hypothetical protein
MPRATIKRTGAFTAHSADGTEYTIEVYHTFIKTRPLNGPPQEIPTGLPRFQTTRGDNVNYLSKGKYQVVGFRSVDVTSDDPNAP